MRTKKEKNNINENVAILKKNNNKKDYKDYKDYVASISLKNKSGAIRKGFGDLEESGEGETREESKIL